MVVTVILQLHVFPKSILHYNSDLFDAFECSVICKFWQLRGATVERAFFMCDNNSQYSREPAHVRIIVARENYSP